MAKLAPVLALPRGAWTARAPLPGGDFGFDEVPQMVSALMTAYPFLDNRWALRLIRAYGTEAWEILGQARVASELGRRFGRDLTEAEVVWLMDHEWARRADDVVWRRSKLGLRMSAEEIAVLDAWMIARTARSAPRALRSIA